MSLTSAQLDQFHRDGYIIVPDLFTDDEMDAALAAMEQIFYGQSFQQWLSDCDQGDASRSLGRLHHHTRPLRGPLAISRGRAGLGSADRKRDLPRHL